MRALVLLATCIVVATFAFPASASPDVSRPEPVAGFEVGPMALLFGGPGDHLTCTPVTTSKGANLHFCL